MKRSPNRSFGPRTPGFRSSSPLALAVLLLVGLLVPALTPTLSARAVEPGLAISGTVTDNDGNPVPDVVVVVFETDPQGSVASLGLGVRTDATGAYLVDNLHPTPGMSYDVCFYPWQSTEYAQECYDDSVFTEPPSVATGVALEPNVDRSGIDASLEPAARITGQVTSATGTPVHGVEVTAWHGDSPCCRLASSWQVTDKSGHYTIDRLKSAAYVLQFRVPGSGTVEYWRDQDLANAADPLVVAAGETLTIDAVVCTVPCTAVANVAAPVISGTVQVGQTLTASGDAWTPEGTTVSYRWVVGSDTVSSDGPTGPTYVPTTDDIGQTIRVHATGTRPGWADGSAWSTPTAAVAPAPLATPSPPPVAAPSPPPAAVRYVVRPRVKGTLEVGRILTVTKGVWQPTAVTLKYRWYAGGKAITGATHRRLTLTAKHVGKRMTVRVKATSPGHPKAIVWTEPTARIKP